MVMAVYGMLIPFGMTIEGLYEGLCDEMQMRMSDYMGIEVSAIY